MRRTLFIVGIIIIVLLASLLLFLLFASDEQKQGIFNTFNFGDTTDATALIDTIVDTVTNDDSATSSIPLRQLTLKPVAGVTEMPASGSSTVKIVYYVEAGTGHIFSLNSISGEENRISNITVPTANDALFTENAQVAAIISNGTSGGKTLTLVTLPQDGKELSSVVLSDKVENYYFNSDGVLLYTTMVGDTLFGKKYTLDTKKTETLFTLPFTEATVRFTNNYMYTYPKRENVLEGYLYSVESGKLTREDLQGYGFSALARDKYVLYTYLERNLLLSGLYDTETKERLLLPFVLMAEKCEFMADGINIFCGVPQSVDKDDVDNWYKGLYTSNDELWIIDSTTGGTTFVANPVELAGRPVDVTKPTSSKSGDHLYFVNKTDKTLWMFDYSQADNSI